MADKVADTTLSGLITGPVNRFAQPATDDGQPIVNRFAQPEIDYSKLGEFDAQNATEGQKWRLALGYLTTPDEKARGDIIRKVLPGAHVTPDPDSGRLVVQYKGETGYIDKPGITLGGVLDTIAQAFKYVPAGKFALGGANLATQVGRAAVAGAGTSVAEDVAAMPQGSEQGVSPERAAITGIASGAGQAVSPAIGKGLQWLGAKGVAAWNTIRGTPQAVAPNGTLTEVGRRMAKEAGLNPDEITPNLARELEAAAQKATQAAVPADNIPLATARQALSQRFQVPLTKGETTGDYAQQSLEENLRRMDVTTRAGTIMRGAEKDSAAALRGDNGATGFGILRQEINPRPVADPGQAGRAVLDATQRTAYADRAAYQAQYKTARESGAALDTRNYKEFVQNAKTALTDTLDYDPNLFPQTAKMLDNLDKRAAWLEEMGRNSPRKIPLAKLENMRKTINALWKSADENDKRGLDVLRGQFDEMVNGALDSGRVVGDKQAVQAWKSGRELYSRFQQLYNRNPRDGQAEQQAGRIVDNWLRSDNVTGEEVITQALRNPALARRIVTINGDNSPAVTALKQGVLEYVFRPALKNDTISPRLIVSQYERFFRGSSAENVRTIFSPRDLAAINEFVQLSKAKIPEPGVVNFSNTGNVLVKAAQQLGQKLGLIGAASGHIETAAALGAINVASGMRSAAQARSAVRGLVPANRVSVPATSAAAAVGQEIDPRDQ